MGNESLATGGALADADDARKVELLRAGDEAAFGALIDRYNGALLRLARTYLHDQTAAEEAVQDAWIGLLESLQRFEGRSSLKTWLFRILVNCARSRQRKESRTIPFSSVFDPDAERREPAVEPERFNRSWVPGRSGHWLLAPARWQDQPEQQALGRETRALILAAVENLPPSQREVITLRDIDGFSPEEVCNLLGVSDTNQRVLLHRARSKVRSALESHLGEGGA